MKNPFTSIALCLGLLSAGSANANLIATDGGLTVYDADANLYWLADANYAKTSGYNADGFTWSQAQSWITSLNTANYLGYSDWRLPTSDICYGYNCTGSEMGNLFYNELGGAAGSSILAATNTAALALFNNVQSYAYWSGTEYLPTSKGGAWRFLTTNGVQTGGYKYYNYFAWPVRSGQVAAVPEPGTEWLLGIGLLGLMGMARRRRLALR